jgi:hypothetical protein
MLVIGELVNKYLHLFCLFKDKAKKPFAQMKQSRSE